jgi:hypothetical protein
LRRKNDSKRLEKLKERDMARVAAKLKTPKQSIQPLSLPPPHLSDKDF